MSKRPAAKVKVQVFPFTNWYIFGKSHLLCGDIKRGDHYEFIQVPIQAYNSQKRWAKIESTTENEKGEPVTTQYVVELDEANIDRYFLKKLDEMRAYLDSIDVVKKRQA